MRDADFVVVRVVATPEALRNKSFDELLAKNGVQLEESTEAETASASAGAGIQEKAKQMRDESESGRHSGCEWQKIGRGRHPRRGPAGNDRFVPVRTETRSK